MSKCVNRNTCHCLNFDSTKPQHSGGSKQISNFSPIDFIFCILRHHSKSFKAIPETTTKHGIQRSNLWARRRNSFRVSFFSHKPKPCKSYHTMSSIVLSLIRRVYVYTHIALLSCWSLWSTNVCVCFYEIQLLHPIIMNCCKKTPPPPLPMSTGIRKRLGIQLRCPSPYALKAPKMQEIKLELKK